MSTLAVGIYTPSTYQLGEVAQSVKEKAAAFAERFTVPAYSKCKHAWSYLGKINIIARQSLTAAAKSAHLIALAGMKFPKILGEVTTRMKLFAVVSIPFSLDDITSTAKKILTSLYVNDKEGIVLSTLSFTVIAADIVDSFTTFFNAAMTLCVGAPLAFFSAMGLPLGFTMAGVGTISRTIQVAKSALLHRAINKEVLSEKSLNKESLKAFLEKTLGINEEMKSLLTISPEQLTEKQKSRIQLLKDNNKAAILRAAPAESLNEMESLLAMLEESPEGSFSPEQQKEITDRFKTIQAQIIKKMNADGMSICANLFSLAALTLFTIGSSTPTPFILLAISFSIRLAVVYYQDQKIAVAAKKQIG